MIITDFQTLVDLPIGSKIWLVEIPYAEVSDVIFNFNLTANVNRFYPFNILEKTNTVEMFKKVGDKRTSYIFNIPQMIQELKDYEQFLTHKFIVTTSEREIISAWKDKIIEFEETTKRLYETSQRFKKDTFQSKLLEKHQIEFPEDWI